MEVYLKHVDGSPKRLRISDDEGNVRFAIVTEGPDGKMMTVDDITVHRDDARETVSVVANSAERFQPG